MRDLLYLLAIILKNYISYNNLFECYTHETIIYMLRDCKELLEWALIRIHGANFLAFAICMVGWIGMFSTMIEVTFKFNGLYFLSGGVWDLERWE